MSETKHKISNSSFSKEDIEEFQDIYLKIYGEKLSIEDAEKQATILINFYKTVLKDARVENALKTGLDPP